MKLPRLKNAEFESIKSDVEAIKAQVNEILICLPRREEQLLAALEANRVADSNTVELLKEQEVAIAKLKVLNEEKSKSLSGMTKWIILIILGLMAATTKYEIQFERGTGIIVRPDADTGMILPAVYAIALIAVATGHDSKIGGLLDRLGENIGG